MTSRRAGTRMFYRITSSLPRDAGIVAYCRGRYCAMSAATAGGRE